MLRRSRPLLAAALLALVALAGCGDSGSASAGSDVAPYQDAFAGLCEARAAAASGDLERAKALFDDQSHSMLHALASDSAGSDREAAGRLLEAKEAVERGFADGGDGLEADLQELQAATRAAIETTGAAAPPPCAS